MILLTVRVVYMKYIGFYDSVKNRRIASLAAVNKMNYICRALDRTGCPVEIISCGMIAGEAIDQTEELAEGDIKVRYFKTRKASRAKMIRIYHVLRQNIVLFFYLLKNVNKKEQILVYHSLGLMRCVYWAKKIKRFRLILEVEEIYNDVFLKSKASRRMEERFIKNADKYIFPTELLNQKLNSENKPFVLIHGTYQVEPDRRERFDDGKIHVVYAGTFDPQKGGSVAAITAVAWLPEYYHVHILGFGSEKDTKELCALIEEINEVSAAKVTYDGLLSGEDYIRFLQRCQIGLSTQNPDAAFNDTSFPSKILSYMANGLRVVTVRIPAIEGSAVGDDVIYYEEQTPDKIAQAILSVDFGDGYDGRKKIEELNKIFIAELHELLSGGNEHAGSQCNCSCI